MRDINGLKDAFFADTSGGSVAHIVGDALSDSELRVLVKRLINTKRADLRAIAPDIAGSGSAESIVQEMTQPELLQLALLCRESDLASALDSTVRSQEIRIPDGEVRRPVTNFRAVSGAFHLRAELGHLGLRFVSNDPGLASLRLRRLLRSLYVQNITADSQELEWQLRGFDAPELDDRLEDFFRTVDPESALKRLVLARKTNMVAACEEVGIEDATGLDDETLVASILWKLGFHVRTEQDVHRRFWQLHERMNSLTGSSRISGMGDSETFRGVATEYFREFEGVLGDSLAFSTFVLLKDHISSERPFQYHAEIDAPESMTLLQSAWAASARNETIEFVDGKNSLHTLFRGFGVLAERLKLVDSEKDVWVRSAEDYPEYRGRTTLKEFVFEHKIAFLDLSASSKIRLQNDLSNISRNLIAAKVNEVRNEFNHYRRTDPEIEMLERALAAVGESVKKLEDLGLTRILHWPDKVSIDAWGRSHHTLVAPRNRAVLFARPSAFDWMGLPALAKPQYVVAGALFAQPNEVLRFSQRYESEYSKLWDKFPRRRKKGEDFSDSADDTPNHASNVPISGSSTT
jgi:hypothetical protein